MANFLKKALNVFVEFDEDQKATNQPVTPTVKNVNPGNSGGNVKSFLNQEDLEKFSKHFDTLFDKANLPGPDYFEFCKMMETLEAHIADEKARMSAVYASLAIQGMTKQKLIESANQYKLIVDKDKSEFDLAVNDKSKKEIESRKKTVEDLEKKIVSNSELIQNLTKEITAAQTKIATVKNEMLEEQNKLNARTGGYKIASDAMLNKIITDIQKLQNNL
jgi:hypothetical protein